MPETYLGSVLRLVSGLLLAGLVDAGLRSRAERVLFPGIGSTTGERIVEIPDDVVCYSIGGDDTVSSVKISPYAVLVFARLVLLHVSGIA